MDLDKFDDILLSFTQRWHIYAKDIYPVIKILTKFFCPDALFNIYIGRTDESDIDRDIFQSANTADFFFLQSTEQLALQMKR